MAATVRITRPRVRFYVRFDLRNVCFSVTNLLRSVSSDGYTGLSRARRRRVGRIFLAIARMPLFFGSYAQTFVSFAFALFMRRVCLAAFLTR